MKRFVYSLLFLSLSFCTAARAQKSNAAPSQHLRYNFASDAQLKMQKVKITASAYTTYFSVFNWAGGYAGLQQTPDSSSGASKILIASQWDPNTAGGVFAKLAYAGDKTKYSRFGGEGDGAKTINPYNWELNTWYNFVIKCWKQGNEQYIATFVQNLRTGVWFHTSTLQIPAREIFLGPRSGAFLENWVGEDPRWDGRFVRKAWFKDCWNLNVKGEWEKSAARWFSANDNDARRNGRYDRSFNAGYSAKEDAYFMEHGGDVRPGPNFGEGRRVDLPEQAGQGDRPQLTIGAVASVTAVYSKDSVTVNWLINPAKSPQFASKVEILAKDGTVLQTAEGTLPQQRSARVKTELAKGEYAARVSITDIFGGQSKPVTVKLIVP
ncbi:DUF3472 domain-containing protein [Chitinophaga sp. GCM10012297]|uniref:DUF3472 domain-containing protein n=1 Tax=Chitinophaga chungangae TaxID=2821488 RepID=A0ABS3YBG8_9BACT|nr:DUF3472 domain-containing protein [Chitinophaga chungangae]MBO9152031.1 DUF3472 domain-containing protein [Chitinophaga chungangae]